MFALALGCLSLVQAANPVVPFRYDLGEKAAFTYEATVSLHGFIPILGGQEGDAEVVLQLRVEGLSSGGDGQLRAKHSLESAKFSFNGAPLPLDVESVRTYFPPATIDLTPLGEVLKTDAPKVDLPVRLPGLDAQRLPEATYLPLLFPSEPLAKWTFRRRLVDSDLVVDASLVKEENDLAFFDLKLNQKYEVLEDASLNVVKDEKDAEWRSETTVDGTGTAAFDRKLGAFRSVQIVVDSTTQPRTLKGEAMPERKLKTTLRLRMLRPVEEPAGKPERSKETR